MGLCSQNELAFLYETLLSGSQNSIEVTNGDMFQIMQYGYVVGYYEALVVMSSPLGPMQSSNAKLGFLGPAWYCSHE